MKRPEPTGRERTFAEHEIIVSKTDLKGRITYVNDIFCKVGLYEEEEVLGQPHSIVRHPEMPRAVFHLLWQRIQNGEEIFAYVKNLAKNGDHYWVLAHVTPSHDLQGRVEGFHSNRRLPRRAALAEIEPLYRTLQAEEQRHADRKQGMQAALGLLEQDLQQRGTDYDRYILGLATRD
ncbi:MAG: PAS domain-containing protein [Ferrovibrio sp.]|uniref:PAS domain-containing protein n=1 Tax=Ferrovibrio sp. TaxID=1917215 RepID=UPI0026057F3F|nr:PAS domain-containing protein [Ferrovibrio sp.]MCW0232776.1 PAS domain-containing protein [Ferrovibrio sp.]